jgi:hypothetical protein
MKSMNVCVRGRSRSLAIAVLAALAVVATGSEAFAQALPGESNTYNPERVGGDQTQQLALQGDFSEARNTSANGGGENLLEVWRGADNNQVWMSFNNGPVFTIGETQTYVAPTVVPWGPNSFLVFHTGVDGRIYSAAVYPDGSNSGSWTPVSNNFTNMPVSVAQMGANSYNVYMVYRGQGDDQRVWGTWWDESNESWSNAENIDGGLSITAPGVVYNQDSRQLFVAAQGLDNNVYMTQQALGADGWATWANQNIATYDTPHMAVTSNGQLTVSIMNANSQPKYGVFDNQGFLLYGWEGDTTGWQSPNTVQLSTNGTTIFALLTGFNGLGYWKQLYNPDR